MNFSQYGLDALAHGPFDGNPIPINIMFAVAGFVVGSILVGYVATAGTRLRKQQQQEAEEDERQRLIPVAEEGPALRYM